jgi:hypothetical protein
MHTGIGGSRAEKLVLETILRGLSDFAKREGLKIRKPRPRVVAEQARSRHAT